MYPSTYLAPSLFGEPAGPAPGGSFPIAMLAPLLTDPVSGGPAPTPTLTVGPTTASLEAGGTLTLVATLRNSQSPLYLTADVGTLSTSSAVTGVPFTYTAPDAGQGPFTVTVRDPNDGLSATCTGTFGVPIPDDLVDAVVALIETQLVRSGALTWFGTGTNGNDNPQLPYAAMGEPDEDDDYWTTLGDSTADGHLEITVFAGTKKAARALGDRVAAILQCAALVQVGAEVTDPALLAVEATIPASPLAFSAGTLVYLRQSGRTAMLDPEPAPGGGDCWDEVRQFHFIYAT